MYRHLAFLDAPRPSTSFLELLWVVSSNDVVARYAGMSVKCLILALLPTSFSHRRVGQAMNMVEASFIFYRGMLPVPHWYSYLLTWPGGLYLPTVVRGCYLTIKVSSLLQAGNLLRSALEAFWAHRSVYGRLLADDELAHFDGPCTICHDDMTSPIQLHCNHVFCEDCVHEWLSRERTCPLCRTEVMVRRQLLATDGTTSLLPVLF